MEHNKHGEHPSSNAQYKRQKKDFTQAFPQEKLKEDMYLRFPAGFEHKHDKWALKLKRNLYRLVQASRNWFLKLSAIFERLGFKQSKSDPCLFLRKEILRPRHKRHRFIRQNTT
jgi:hypothetical protein